jgi:polysaccharide export outer membrane protein
VLGPGDVIEISVTSHEGYDRTLPIQPDGRIQFPLVGEIIAVGLTPQQLGARLAEALNAELIDPSVVVMLKSPRPEVASRQVSLLGAVKNQGSYPIGQKSTVTELLALAGGPLPTADLSRITIARSDRTQVLTVDLSRLARDGSAEADVGLAVGDLVIVPTGAAPTVQVRGEVARGGTVEIQPQTRVVDAIALAGGAKPTADLARVLLLRGGRETALNIAALSSGNASARVGHPQESRVENPILQAGDTIVVPENQRQVQVIGYVVKPDVYPLRDGERLFDLIARTGGATRDADLAKAMLVRRDGAGNAKVRKLDLRPLLTRGDMRRNVDLQPGDVLIVPGKKPSSGRSLLSTVLLPITGLLNFLRY